ncbi:MAG: CarD family transcriptional regulator [Myxococcales bacterium]|nr:CarD family transcriptional regulator [Myxococcales bacterium]
MQFDVGDKAVYPAQGVAVFTGEESKEIMGHSHNFFVWQVLDSKKKIMIPVDKINGVGLRPVISDEEVDQVYAILRERDVKLNDQIWLRRYQSYTEKINTGSIFEVAQVLRDLILRKTEKPLSFGEQKMLDQARRLVIQEMSVAKGTDKDEIDEELDQIFRF